MLRVPKRHGVRHTAKMTEIPRHQSRAQEIRSPQGPQAATILEALGTRPASFLSPAPHWVTEDFPVRQDPVGSPRRLPDNLVQARGLRCGCPRLLQACASQLFSRVALTHR